MKGVWLGTIVSADSLNVGNTILTVKQTEGDLSGTWSVKFPGTSNGGTLEGSVTSEGGLVDLMLYPASIYQCPMAVQAGIEGGHAKGSYETVQCPYTFQGSISVSRQTPVAPTYTHAFPPGGLYDSFQTVSLEARSLYEPVTVFYTLDGTAPKEGQSSTHSGASPLKLDINTEGTTELSYFSVDNSGFVEPVRKVTFHIGVSPQSPVFCEGRPLALPTSSRLRKNSYDSGIKEINPT